VYILCRNQAEKKRSPRRTGSGKILIKKTGRKQDKRLCQCGSQEAGLVKYGKYTCKKWAVGLGYNKNTRHKIHNKQFVIWKIKCTQWPIFSESFPSLLAAQILLVDEWWFSFCVLLPFVAIMSYYLRACSINAWLCCNNNAQLSYFLTSFHASRLILRAMSSLSARLAFAVLCIPFR